MALREKARLLQANSAGSLRDAGGEGGAEIDRLLNGDHVLASETVAEQLRGLTVPQLFHFGGSANS
jgi:hypothetical protein